MQKKKQMMVVMGIVCGLLLLTECGKLRQEQKNVVDNAVFSTFYSIDEYCHGCYIVSEPGQKLQGMLDREGNEILPIEYDSIVFLNEKELEQEQEQIVYVKTKKGQDYAVFNGAGKCIVEGDAECISYKIGGIRSDTYHFMLERPENHTLTFFDERGFIPFVLDYYTVGDENVIKEIARGNIHAYCTWITEEMYLLQLTGHLYNEEYIQTRNYNEVILYNKYGQMIKKWEKAILGYEAVLDNKYVFTIQNAAPVFVYTVDENGNFTEEGLLSENKEYMLGGINKQELLLREDSIHQTAEDSKVFYLGEENDIQLALFSENCTLTDKNGNALYEEQYKKCEKMGDYYFLKGESGKAYLIDKNAKILLDDHNLTWDGEEKYINGRKITMGNILMGDDGICFVLRNVEENKVYFFGRK